MKKFFSKLPVMICSWCLTVVALISMIVVASRPVSYDWTYKCDEQDVLGLGEEQEMSITFDDDELEMFIEVEGMTFEMEMWYLRNGDKYAVRGFSSMPPLIQKEMGMETMSSIEFSAEVKELKADKERWREVWASADNISAFKCEFRGVEFVCHTAIVTMVISSILFVAGLALAIVSTVLFVQEKKKPATAKVSNQTQTNISQSNIGNTQPVEQTKVEGQIEIEEIEK